MLGAIVVFIVFCGCKYSTKEHGKKICFYLILTHNLLIFATMKGIGTQIIRLLTTDSTNNHAKELLKKERPAEGVVIMANEQTAGRGASLNSWQSMPGKNLTCSLIIYPSNIEAINQFVLSKICSLALVEVLKLNGIEALIKWPNDIIADQRKIAGVLIENSLSGVHIQHSIIGIGLNINQEHFGDALPQAVSMKMLCGRYFDIEAILMQFCDAFAKVYAELNAGRQLGIDKAYLKFLFGLNVPLVFISDRGELDGIIKGVNVSGQLQVKTASGALLSFGFKEIAFKL